MSTLTTEAFPIYGRGEDWFEALSKTDLDSWSRTRGRSTSALTSSTARIAEKDIVRTLTGSSLDFPPSSDITWAPEIEGIELLAIGARVVVAAVDTSLKYAEAPDLTARILKGLLTGRVPTRHIIVNVGNVIPFRRHLEERIVSPVGVEVASRVQDLFLRAEGELAETGSAEDFGHRLQSIIREVGVPAVDAIAQAIQRRGTRDSLVFEALRHTGMIEHPPSYRRRFDLLVEGLNSPSPRVRDGAGLGLAFLDDPAAIPHLEEAIRKERVPDLKNDLQLVLDQLVETATSAPSA